MMKKTIMKTVVMVMIIVSMFMLTACPDTGSSSSMNTDNTYCEDQSIAVAVVAGWRTGNNEITVNTEEIKEAVFDSCYSYGYVSFARVDGIPEQYIKVTIPKPEIDGLSETKLKSIADGYTDEIFTAYKQYGAAIYPEADTLEAIRIEANELRATGPDTVKHLVIIDSGLSTTGYLDFTKEEFFEASTDDIIHQLEQEQAIPDLSGISITWFYCGDVAEPQEKLSEVRKHKIIDTYSAIFDAGNASDYVFKEDVPTARPYTDLPVVSTVYAGERAVTPFKTIILDESQVSFIGDEAVFIDPVKAKKAIRKAADSLDANPQSKVYVVGSTAGMDGNSEWCQELSDARAMAVVNVLEEYGISGDRLIPIGLGSNAPWHIADIDSEGNWIEEKAQLNRCVYIVDINDPEYGAAISSFCEQ